MSVWFAIPSKKPAPEAQACIDLWRQRGYRVAIWRDTGDAPVDCDLLLTGEYCGYSVTVNALCQEILRVEKIDASTIGNPREISVPRFGNVEWIVTGGDDGEPDPTHDPEQIARECTEHFGGTFGVMQPTGDRWGADPRQPNYCGSAYIDRVAGSPWLGAEFCRRMYGGRGPLCDAYWHMFEDEELQAVALKLGVFWQRPDLIHFHRHWGRTSGKMPEYIRRANEKFNRAREMFNARKAAGFPGHEPL